MKENGTKDNLKELRSWHLHRIAFWQSNVFARPSNVTIRHRYSCASSNKHKKPVDRPTVRQCTNVLFAWQNRKIVGRYDIFQSLSTAVSALRIFFVSNIFGWWKFFTSFSLFVRSFVSSAFYTETHKYKRKRGHTQTKCSMKALSVRCMVLRSKTCVHVSQPDTDNTQWKTSRLPNTFARRNVSGESVCVRCVLWFIG